MAGLWHTSQSAHSIHSGLLMNTQLESQVRECIAAMPDPNSGRTLTDTATVRSVGLDGSRLAVDIELAYPAKGDHEALVAAIEPQLLAIVGIDTVSISLYHKVQPHQVQEGLSLLEGVRNIIAVASGKGGVGKSTIAANLALALQAEGARVGLLDADIYGPSQQRMLGLEGKPGTPDGKHFTPMQAHGLQAMSIGVLIGEDTPMIWRGPMVTQTLQQLLNDTLWDNLDYLIVDLPPGTGDIQLTLAQRVPVAGAVIVTTPQDLALLDASRALQMFAKVKIPVLGIIENMATHICSACGHEEAIFGSGGGERMAQNYEVPLLGSLPLDIRIREQADQGRPTVVAEPESELAMRYREIARCTAAHLALQARNKRIAFPKIVVRDD